MVFLATPTIPAASISAESREAFGSPSSPPWCRQLLADTRLQPVASTWRDRDQTISKEDSLLASTLRTPQTIRAWQSLYRPPSPSSPSSPPPGAATAAAGDTGDGDDVKAPLAGELLSLVALGSGVNGHDGVAHGGMTAVLLDVAMGSACSLFSTEGDSTYTVELRITYLRPLATPGVYLIRAWLQRTSGRKAWLRAVIEDGDGTVYVESEAFWLDVKAKKSRL